MLGGKPSVDLLILPCLDEEIEQWSYFVFCDDACFDSLVTGKCSNNQAIVPLWCCLKACWLHTRCWRSKKPGARCMTILLRHSIGLDNDARDVSRTWLNKKGLYKKYPCFAVGSFPAQQGYFRFGQDVDQYKKPRQRPR